MRPEHAKTYEDLIRNWENREKLEKETGMKVLGGYIDVSKKASGFSHVDELR